jgi:chromate reductase, NAD(P)H dehydrogenase (quinone)
MQITTIVGTNRNGSMSLKIGTKIQKLYSSLGVTSNIIDLRELPAEIFTPMAYKEKPTAFQPFQNLILESAGLHFIVPEYNGSYPGILKYFIDMWKYPDSFENRCVAYTGVAAGQWGGLRSVEHLQGVLGYRNAFQFNERIFINNIYSRWDWENSTIKKLNEKEFDIEELIQNQVKNFVEFCRVHHS